MNQNKDPKVSYTPLHDRPNMISWKLERMKMYVLVNMQKY